MILTKVIATGNSKPKKILRTPNIIVVTNYCSKSVTESDVTLSFVAGLLLKQIPRESIFVVVFFNAFSLVFAKELAEKLTEQGVSTQPVSVLQKIELDEEPYPVLITKPGARLFGMIGGIEPLKIFPEYCFGNLEKNMLIQLLNPISEQNLGRCVQLPHITFSAMIMLKERQTFQIDKVDLNTDQVIKTLIPQIKKLTGKGLENRPLRRRTDIDSPFSTKSFTNNQNNVFFAIKWYETYSKNKGVFLLNAAIVVIIYGILAYKLLAIVFEKLFGNLTLDK